MVAFFQIPKALVFQIGGLHAERYLQARLTNDIKRLGVGSGCLAAALTPQGRTQGLFRVGRVSADSFLLTCDGGNSDAVLPALKKYIAADRLTVDDRSSELFVLHILGSIDGVERLLSAALRLPSVVMPAHELSVQPCADGYIQAARRSADLGFDVVVGRKLLGDLDSFLISDGAEALSEADRTMLRIRAGVLSFPEELNEDALFSEAGLLNAVSFKKGCYVGQEVVEKIDAIGKLSRKLRRVRLDGLPAVTPSQAVLSSSGEEIGEIVTAASDRANQKTWIFASMKNTAAGQPGAVVSVLDATGVIVD